MNSANESKMPLIIHDLQDSQMFALAQAAGRAGIEVSGSSWPMEPWVESSVYVQKSVEMRCLSEVIAGTYARQWKLSGLQGVWLPCVDDSAQFTAKYKVFFESIGMNFLVPSIESMEKAIDIEQVPDVEGLKVARMRTLFAQDLLEHLDDEKFPLIIKSKRNAFQRFDDATSLRQFILEDKEPAYRIQDYIEGSISKMASAIVLFDADSRPVRGFTGRRLNVAHTKFGAFGETLAARAEWIPELYEGACELLSALQWKGFAEVECKQAPDGDWYVMEINPRVSGWTCLAEADGAGLLTAYYQLCSQDIHLEEACLQHSKADYVRMVATCYHDPEWDAPAYKGIWKKCKRLRVLLMEYREKHPWRLLGAWDARDLKASLQIAWRTVYRVFKVSRIK
ncbi:MAG: hypothetical protein Q9M14_03700 [Mariprofundaceae bacterium]|nr:hypothetical protein [Mariprofundaceae bacterium]